MMTNRHGQLTAESVLFSSSSSSSSSSKAAKTYGRKDKNLAKTAHLRIFPACNLTNDIFWRYYAVLAANSDFTLTTQVAPTDVYESASALESFRDHALTSFDAGSGTGFFVVETRKPLRAADTEADPAHHHDSTSTGRIISTDAARVLGTSRLPFLGYISLLRVRVVPTDLSFEDAESDVAKLEFGFRPELVAGGLAVEALQHVLLDAVYAKKEVRKVVVAVHPANAAAAGVLEGVGFKHEKSVEGLERFGFGSNEARELFRKLNPIDPLNPGAGGMMLRG
ncbi:hypothetical protein H9P43_009651 [Blastocladiella emersonii ATCC 22665]|nr:hypothetical protein H9P43_009651 [Blastocladiella emersonii ATCC 22665]